MLPIYTQALLENREKVNSCSSPADTHSLTRSLGHKLKDVRHEYLVENIIGPEGPFPEIVDLAVADMEKIINTTCNELREDVVAILKTIRVAFQCHKNKKRA
jgi:hypothetical protein